MIEKGDRVLQHFMQVMTFIVIFTYKVVSQVVLHHIATCSTVHEI